MIRRATIHDAELLAELGASTFVETFGHLYKPEDLRDYLSQAHSVAKYSSLLSDSGTAIWIGSDDEGHALAYGIACKCGLPAPGLAPSAGEINRIYVRASARNLKLGSKLMNVMLDWLQSRGHQPLYIGVWSENHAALRFYGRFGFEKAGEYEFAVGRQLDREFILRRR